MGYKYNYTNDEINKMIDLYVNQLKSLEFIAKEFNVDSSTIKKRLKDNNIIISKVSPYNTEYWIARGFTYDEAVEHIKSIRPTNIQYWLNKGYNQNEAEFKVELQTMKTERAYIYKYGDMGKEMFKKFKHNMGKKTSPRSIDYWICKGYDEADSIKMVAKTQRTYSRDILYEKYGSIIGEEKMKDRNEKWLKTLNNKANYSSIQKTKDSNSVNFYKEKYGEEYIEFYLNEQVVKLFNTTTKLKIINNLKSSNYIGFLETIKNNYKYDIRLIHRISNISIINIIFNKSNNEIKEDLLKLYSVRNKNGFGTTYSINGKIVRSLGEMKIYERLLNMGVDFEYDKIYPNQKTHYKCDFYLTTFDLYIEYAGMLNVKKNKNNEKILEAYDSRLKLKKAICVNNNLKHFFSNSVEEILNFIENIYGEKN